MLAVPFENMDIDLKHPIHVGEKAIWNKITINHRGGFCYELNGSSTSGHLFLSMFL